MAMYTCFIIRATTGTRIALPQIFAHLSPADMLLPSNQHPRVRALRLHQLLSLGETHALHTEVAL
eukprot:9463330-Prorocentrum_lima.AAC.1